MLSPASAVDDFVEGVPIRVHDWLKRLDILCEVDGVLQHLSSRGPFADRCEVQNGQRYPTQRGFFSPASTAMASLFSGGATGHVAKSVNEHGRFAARLKSRATVPPASGPSI